MSTLHSKIMSHLPILTEKYVGNTKYYGEVAEVFKNPTDSELKECTINDIVYDTLDLRGFIDREGNLYTVKFYTDAPELLHSDIAKVLQKVIDPNFPIEYYLDFDKYLAIICEDFNEFQDWVVMLTMYDDFADVSENNDLIWEYKTNFEEKNSRMMLEIDKG